MSSPDSRVSCLDATFNCAQLVPDCYNPNGFDFPTLWNITQRYFEQCPKGPWLFHPHGEVSISLTEASLTLAATVAIVGAGWKVYPASDIWFRFTTWKFPLWQLVSNSPRPPLGFWVECFSVFHLLGNPMGAIRDLLRKLHDCQARENYWRFQLTGSLQHAAQLVSIPVATLSKKLAIISNSFDEYGIHTGDIATKAILDELARPLLTAADRTEKKLFLNQCILNANVLAADRSTKFFPIVVAQGFFIGNIIIALIRTKSLSSGPNPATFVNIAAYSIGFSALFFWVIFAVFLSSIIGTSQTDPAIPRTLGRLRSDLHTIVGTRIEAMPTVLSSSIRVRDGGVYSWQPGRRTTILPSRRELPWTTLAYFSLTAAAATGWGISYLVPPVGWGCRNYGELIIYLIWIFSALFEDLFCFICFIFLRNHPLWEFWITFVKDFLCMGTTMGMVIASQVGIYNSAKCYTLYGVTGLALPGMESVMNTLSNNIDSVYPAITAIGIGLQLIFLPGIVIWMYGPAMRVFLQRDDGQSSFPLRRRWFKAT